MNLKTILIISVFCLGLSKTQAQKLINVYPEEYSYALKNPLKGFRDKANKDIGQNNSYTTIVRDYIKWSEIENDSSDGVEKIIDFCNERWKDYEKSNIKVIPRVYILWSKKMPDGNWPSDLTSGDWTSQEFKDRVVKLIYKLGLAWDNDPRVAWVQTGIIGYWGEQENPVGVDEDGWGKRLGEAYTTAFKNKKLLVRNQRDWDREGYFLGTYWDSWAHPGQPRVYEEIKERNNQGRYLTEIIEGEVAYNWGMHRFTPMFGASPTATCNSYQYSSNLIDLIKDLHCTGLGWISAYEVNGADSSNIDSVKANALRIQEAFGYNFIISQFSCPTSAKQGNLLNFSLKIKNLGSAPFYENWPLALVLIDEESHEIVWQQKLTNVDIRKWLPGDNYSYATKTYQNPAKEYSIDTAVTIPETIKNGNYLLGVTILEPYSETPGVFFDIKNFLSKSQTQPLCRIGIGEKLKGSYKLNPSLFGDPFADDHRYYSLTPQGFGYTLTAGGTNGSVILHPAGGKYLPGTVVTVIAKANQGYKFNSWNGMLLESATVTTITMDGNKNITAVFDRITDDSNK